MPKSFLTFNYQFFHECSMSSPSSQENGGDEMDSSQGKSQKQTLPNLNIAQIVVTCATPMVEEEKKFPEVSDEPPPSTEPPSNGVKAEKISEKENQPEVKEQCDDGFGSDNFDANFDANFEANFEDAFASQTVEEINASGKKDSPSEGVPKQVVGGRASIPEELDSHQLARLQSLKESNA